MSDTVPDHSHWSAVATQWIAWARTPGHDAYWHYRDALRTYIGEGDGRALEVGCGEGRVCRDLKSLGYTVTATDAVAELVAAARESGSADEYGVADLGGLPFADDSFDLVVAYNVLMDVRDFDVAVAEMARVLSPGGRVIVSLVHPFTDRGRFAEDNPSSPFVVDGDYFSRQKFSGTEFRDGLTMQWSGWSRPLQDYVASFAAHGLLVSDMTEPKPVTEDPSMARWSRLPLFLWTTLRPG